MSVSPNKIRMFVVELTFLIKDKKKKKKKNYKSFTTNLYKACISKTCYCKWSCRITVSQGTKSTFEIKQQDQGESVPYIGFAIVTILIFPLQVGGKINDFSKWDCERTILLGSWVSDHSALESRQTNNLGILQNSNQYLIQKT